MLILITLGGYVLFKNNFSDIKNLHYINTSLSSHQQAIAKSKI